jgi:hypothetical protein
MVSELLSRGFHLQEGGCLMKIVRKLLTLGLAVMMTTPSPALADGRHLVPPEKLAAALAQHVERQNADRSAVRGTLALPQVRQIAQRVGLDVDRAIRAVDTLADADLARAADSARQINQRLVGGQTVTLTTTTIIIALLIVILIVVAVD